MNDVLGFIEIWTVMKNYVAAKDLNTAAEQYIEILDSSGYVDFTRDTEELFGACDVFDAVLRVYLEENDYNNNEYDEEYE